MSPISLCLNLLLATLLSLTLLLGWRVNRRLKALRDGHAGFTAAVADLDRAAGRAEKGLADLRAATDEAVEFLSGRIEKGRELAAKLERLTATAAHSADRAEAAAVKSALAPNAAPSVARPAAFDRAPFAQAPLAADRLRGRAAPDDRRASLPADAEAAAELLALRLSEALDGQLSPAPPARPSPRSRAVIDDDLFETPARPAPRPLGGGR